MTKLYSLISTITLVLFSTLFYAQVTTIDFEVAGDGYTPSANIGAGFEDIFNRTNADLPSCTNETGFFWAIEDISGNPSMTLDQINVSGSTSFTFAIDLVAHHFQDWDSADEVLITYSIDGGTFQNLMWIQSIPDGDAFNQEVGIDTDFDGDGECTSLLGALTQGTAFCGVTTSQFQTFTSPAILLGGNSTLDISIQVNGLTSGDEGLYLDNIVVTEAGVACTAPTTQATAATGTGTTTTTGTLNWTSGNGNAALVVLQAGSAAGTPSSGTTYTDNSIFGSGDAIGSGFVVYEGTGSSVSITNLIANTTYHYAIYEYASTGTCYLTPGLTGTFTTPAIGTLSDIISSGGESLLVPSTETTPGPLTSAQGIKVWDFTIRDGGATGDADVLPTILEDFTITQSATNQMNDWDIALQSVDLFDGTTHIATGVISSNQINFSGLSITAADDASTTITMRISLNCPSNSTLNLDGDDFGFQISQGNVTEAGTGTSQFASFPLARTTNGLNEYDLNSFTITSITPASGPVGTVVTINATGGGFTGATSVSIGGTAAASFNIISDTEIEAVIANGTTSGDVIVTDPYCLTDIYSAFSVIEKNTSTCEGTVTFSDIIMSEVYDNDGGSLGYIEIYNGTGATVDLTGYTIERYGDLTITTSTHSYSFPGTGIGSSIADGQVLVGRVSTGGVASTHDFSFVGNGFNADDRLELFNGTTLIDDFHDDVIGADGFVYRRNTTITGPNPAYDGTEWTTASEGDVSHLGTYNVSSGSEPIITTQPTTSQICAQSDAIITTAATEGFAGGMGLVYQWYESVPGTPGWTALTDGGVISGATTATLTISPADGFNGYQYYCQVREDGVACYVASDAVRLNVYGSGGTPGLWTGSTDTDWCDCFNWDDGKIPVATTNITIDETATNDCIATTGCVGIGSTLAISSLNGTNTLLTISGTGSVNITNALTISKTAGTGNLIVETTGSGTLTAGTITITGSGITENATLRNESATTTIDVNGDLTIATNGSLDLNPNGTINVAGDFLNNNSTIAFDEANSTVIFDGAVDQNINTNGFTEVFHNITLAKTGGLLILQDNIDTDASGIIALSDDQIDLNDLQLRVLNPATTAFTRTSGSVIEESGAATGNNAGKLVWDIGTTTGIHSFPFATGTGGVYIPFEFELTAGNAGEVSLSTYGTIAANTPWPSAPEAVTNLNSTGGLTPDNRDATADRFWQIDVENTATATITFSYQNSELPVAPFADHNGMIAQRYNSTLNQWEVQIYPGQTKNIIPGGYTVTVPNISAFSPWTLAHVASPLPAELIKFDATKSNEIAILDWTTASEINTEEFVLEKSKDGVDFTPFATSEAAGNSNGILNYQDIDYAPYSGFNFYRLKTVDFDGSFQTSEVKSLYFGNEISTVIYDNNEWVLAANELKMSQVQLINSLGQFVDLSTILSQSDNEVRIQHNNLAAGIYIIQINNGLETINLKVIK